MEAVADVAVVSVDFDSEATARSVASELAKDTRYRDDVNYTDVLQELRVYYLGRGAKEVGRHVLKNRAAYARKTLRDHGRKWCEQERANRRGYHVDDLAWYTPGLLTNLMPMVLSPGWDGLSGDDTDPGQPRGKSVPSEGQSLLAMVCDVRRVLGKERHPLSYYDPGTESGALHLEQLAEKLGGGKPVTDPVGSRRVISNAAAAAKTEGSY